MYITWGTGLHPLLMVSVYSHLCDSHGVINVFDTSFNVQLPVQYVKLTTVKSVILKMSTNASSAMMAILWWHRMSARVRYFTLYYGEFKFKQFYYFCKFAIFTKFKMKQNFKNNWLWWVISCYKKFPWLVKQHTKLIEVIFFPVSKSSTVFFPLQGSLRIQLHRFCLTGIVPFWKVQLIASAQ